METPTGERLIPELQRDALIYAEHLARYRLAAQLLPGRRVLDAGCGEGYGAALFATLGATSVVGVDLDKETVARARARYGLDFRAADVADLPFEDECFDVIACFETIEHVSNPERALAELRRVLVPGGVLMISTPNRNQYLVQNEFHVREFSPEELDELLDEHFPERTWLYQQNWLLSAILDEQQFRADEETELGLEVVKTVSLEPGHELYSVVICGRVDSLPPSMAVASGVHEAHRMAETVAQAERQRQAWQDRATLAERQREGWEKRATTAERQREAWEERASEAERQVGETREQLARAEDALEKLAASLSWRVTRPLRWIGARLPLR